MEIERKFLPDGLPRMLAAYSHVNMEQGYLCTDPVVRVRSEDGRCSMTYKGSGMLKREEYNLPLGQDGYAHLIKKADGIIIKKTRYFIAVDELDRWNDVYTPRQVSHSEVGCGKVVELDVFGGEYEGLCLAEIEFDSEKQAVAFEMPACFLSDVTGDERYHNSSMSKGNGPKINNIK